LFEEHLLLLQKLNKEHSEGKIKLFYFDESGFSLTPNIPYAWQGSNCNHTLPSSSGGHLNVLGMISPDNEFKSYIVKGKVDSKMAIEVFDHFFKYKRSNKDYVIVLDNARIHKSEEFENYIEKCKKRGIRFHFIPPYSPELNKIEILWKFIKERWLPLDCCKSFEHMIGCLVDVLRNIGGKYRINFG